MLPLPCYHKGFSTRASRSCSRCTIMHPCSAPLIRLPGPPRSSCSEDFFAQLLPIPTSASDLCDSFRALRLFQTPKTSSDLHDSFRFLLLFSIPTTLSLSLSSKIVNKPRGTNDRAKSWERKALLASGISRNAQRTGRKVDYSSLSRSLSQRTKDHCNSHTRHFIYTTRTN